MKKNKHPVRPKFAAAIRTQIRHYERCLKMLPRVDAEVCQAGMELFEDEATLALWLCQPARALDGKIPLQAMRTVRGRRKVADILVALSHGNIL